MSISKEIKTRIEENTDKIVSDHPLFKKMADGSLSKEELALYLFNLKHMLSQTPRHLTTAAQICSDRGWSQVETFFKDKLVEEIGHDTWAQNDLDGLTGQAESNLEVTPAVRKMVQEIDNLIEKDPRLYISYIAFTEYFTVLAAPFILRSLKESLGLPSTGVSVIANHEEADKGHIEEDLEVMAGFTDSMGDEVVMTIDRSSSWISSSMASFVLSN